ncbi:hypothetical protein IP79_09475 [Porphyrobacter sp. AAP60]|nr:hypothetical protein IP79_09475 [Porphyrobacter sp. AAP60]
MAVPSASHAAGKEEQKIMQMVSECAYVVRIAEGNGVSLNNPSSTWDQAKAATAVKLQIDPARYDAEARAKYKKRERVMGAAETMQKVIQRARDCDAQL